jgi:hypothetical protein
MNWRCMMTNTAITGSVVMVSAAKYWFQSESYCWKKATRPSGMV